MKSILLACLLATAAISSVAAADGVCDSRAADKKLSGAAKTSFLKKCEREAAAASAQDQCTSAAADKKLNGAAKNSFVKKCVKDAAK